ncbi:hypothetical protein EWM64_g5171 [Hericium alpestre]|uniref:Protein kinase domain-containing protein n=1 Tax=Hericium alpestre TaxID=135208 RepID=A0A4Y9ZVK3_9AGAM|nr:hypothetical protein EWM64_g5171 [Hericium alpestre]
MAQPLVQNAISTLVINGLIEGLERPVSLKRIDVPADLIEPFQHEESPHVRPNGAPARRPSTLPKAGNLTLSCSILDAISNGRDAVVFGADNTELSDSSVQLPPLVLKMARRWQGNKVMKEAWVYDEMESIQGIAIPRCYGLFQVDLGGYIEPRPWTKEFDGKDPDDEAADDVGFTLSRGEFNKLPPILKEFIHHPDRLCVLVLERLGDELPSKEPISDEDKKDILDLYLDIAQFSIEDDWQGRRQNILRAADVPPGLPGSPSPNTKKIHKWRLVDFTAPHKTNLKPEYVHLISTQDVRCEMDW